MTVVSIIVPTWHRHALLRDRLIPSVLVQTIADFECLIVSDGPDGDVRTIVDSFGDARLRPLSIPRPMYPTDPIDFACAKGIRAINRGIDEARGEWLLISGDDDEFPPDALERLLETAEPEDDVIFGRTDVLQRNGSWIPVADGPPIFRLFPTGGSLARRSRVGDLRLNPDAYLAARDDPELHPHGDTDFWRRLAAAGLRFRPIPDIVFRYYPSGVTH